MDLSFWKGKRVFLTGHTGFKGSWLSYILVRLGAKVTGYSLPSPTNPALFDICGVETDMNSVIGDIRNFSALYKAFCSSKPEIVIHMAAQPLVWDSYQRPAYTYETNVMGTVNILECLRLSNAVKSFLNVTTDKVYRNNEWEWGYRETDALDGHDPYSNSKSCSELVTLSYQRSFFSGAATAISTARAGNVIGGGDFSDFRIIPDCIRSASKGEKIEVRNPDSIRPYQHVLEPLGAYLLIARVQYENPLLAGNYNVGPDENDCVTTGKIADLFCNHWGDSISWEFSGTNGPHEANFLRLDCSRIRNTLHWRPRWDINRAIKETIIWSKEYMANGDVCGVMNQQIRNYLEVE